MKDPPSLAGRQWSCLQNLAFSDNFQPLEAILGQHGKIAPRLGETPIFEPSWHPRPPKKTNFSPLMLGKIRTAPRRDAIFGIVPVFAYSAASSSKFRLKNHSNLKISTAPQRDAHFRAQLAPTTPQQATPKPPRSHTRCPT